MWTSSVFCFFFFNDTATTEIYTLSLHDALPILLVSRRTPLVSRGAAMVSRSPPALSGRARGGIGGNMPGGGRGVGRGAPLVPAFASPAVPPLAGRRNSIGCRKAVATASPRRRAGAKRSFLAPASAAESSPE